MFLVFLGAGILSNQPKRFQAAAQCCVLEAPTLNPKLGVSRVDGLGLRVGNKGKEHMEATMFLGIT